jgi:hypothetical protein
VRNVCNDCHRDFDDRQKGTWKAVTGWVVERDAGGANAVRGKEYTGAVLCPACGKLRDLGVNRGQTSLL